MRSLARCCDTVAAGLPTRSARVLTDSSPPASARTILTRVASASIENTSTATSTRSSPAPAAMLRTPTCPRICAHTKIIVGERDRRNLSLAGPFRGWSAGRLRVLLLAFGRGREAAGGMPLPMAGALGAGQPADQPSDSCAAASVQSATTLRLDCGLRLPDAQVAG